MVRVSACKYKVLRSNPSVPNVIEALGSGAATFFVPKSFNSVKLMGTEGTVFT
jgi:hypothetical protein